MEYVGTEFRKIEDEMVDYAASLQFDPMISSLKYEPKPFRTMEEYIKRDYDRLLYTLKRPDRSEEEKVKEMTEFVFDTYRKFTVKVSLGKRRTRRW